MSSRDSGQGQGQGQVPALGRGRGLRRPAGPGPKPGQPQPQASGSRPVVELSETTSRDSMNPEASSVSRISSDLKKLTLSSGSSLRLFPKRPDIGQEGKPIRLLANHFPLNFSNIKVYHYDVVIDKLRSVSQGDGDDEPIGPAPDDSNKRYRKLLAKTYISVIEEVVKQNSNSGQAFHGILPVFDGLKNLYAKKPISLSEERQLYKSHEVLRLMVKVNVDGRDARYAINFKFASEIDLSLLRKYYEGSLSETPLEALQALDIILRHGPNIYKIPIASSLYMPAAEDTNRLNLGGGRQLAYGYYQSVRPVNSGTMLVIDRTATAFYEGGPVLRFIATVFEKRLEALLGQNGFSDSEKMRIEKEIKGLQVKVNHLTYTRKYKVNGISREPASAITFDYQEPDAARNLVNAGKMSLVEFFLKQHKKTLKHPNLPCLVVGSAKRPNFLPLELCDLVGDQHVRQNLTGDQTAQLIRASASQKPVERFNVIRKSGKSTYQDSKPYLTEFGITITPRPLNVDGRVLEPPQMAYSGGNVKPFEGKWDMRYKKMTRGATLRTDEWVIVSFVPEINDVTELVTELKRRGAAVGIAIEEPAKSARLQYSSGALEGVFEKARSVAPNLRLVMFIIFQNDELYREIKFVGDVKKKVVTQCIHQKNMRRLTEPYIVNVLLKINAKLGGINAVFAQNAEMPDFLKKKTTMTIGVDVTHPSPADRMTNSISACVANDDNSFGSWASSVRIKKQAQDEMIEGLDDMFCDLYTVWASMNGNKLPEEVIIFRDGVSEGQFMRVLDVEVAAIRGAYEKVIENVDSITDSPPPKLTFVIVQKRHHTRMIPEREADGAGKARNIPPGTVVDTDIVHPRDFDFFLCSHEGIQVSSLCPHNMTDPSPSQGTSRPTRYYVLLDENKFEADVLQTVTFWLCHCFVRCMRSISAPTPVAYANLAAYRARLHYLGMKGGDAGLSSGSGCGPTRGRRLHEAGDTDEDLIRVDGAYSNRLYYV